MAEYGNGLKLADVLRKDKERMGSGTTGVACLKLKRNFIGIEKDKEIYDLAYKRISEQSDKRTSE